MANGFDVNNLSRGDQIIGVSGIVLFIFSFFDWLGAKVPGTAISGADSAWGFTLTLIAVLIGIAMLVYVVLKAMGVDMPNLGNVTWAQVLLVAAGIAFLFVLIKLIAGPHIDTAGFDVNIDKTRKFGIFIGLIATAGLVFGAWLNYQAGTAGGGTRPAGGGPAA